MKILCMRCFFSILWVVFLIKSIHADTLPEFFGLYLRSGEQLIELQPETVERGGLAALASPAVSQSSLAFILYHDQRSPHDLRLNRLNYVFRANAGGTWQPTGAISLKIAPVEGKASIYLLVPGAALDDGVYALHFGALQGSGLENQAYPVVVGNPQFVVDLTISTAKADAYAENQATWDQAVAVYQQVLQIAPKQAELQKKLALLYYQQQHYQSAIEAYERLLTLAPETPGIQDKLFASYLYLAQAAMQKQEYSAALDFLSRALPIAEQSASENIAAIAGLQAEIYFEQGDADQAVAAAHKAVEQGVTTSKPYTILAFHSLKQGNQQEALQFLNEAAQRGFGQDIGGYLIVNTGYGDLTIPVQDIKSVSLRHVSTKYDEVFVGNVRFQIDE